MKARRRTLWLLLLSQVMFLISSVIEPPTSGLMIALRVLVPLIAIVFIGLMLAGYMAGKKSSPVVKLLRWSLTGMAFPGKRERGYKVSLLCYMK